MNVAWMSRYYRLNVVWMSRECRVNVVWMSCETCTNRNSFIPTFSGHWSPDPSPRSGSWEPDYWRSSLEELWLCFRSNTNLSKEEVVKEMNKSDMNCSMFSLHNVYLLWHVRHLLITFIALRGYGDLRSDIFFRSLCDFQRNIHYVIVSKYQLQMILCPVNTQADYVKVEIDKQNHPNHIDHLTTWLNELNMPQIDPSQQRGGGQWARRGRRGGDRSSRLLIYWYRWLVNMD